MKYINDISHRALSLLALVLTVCAMGLTSCHSTKKAAQPASGDYAALSLDSRFDALAAASGEWTELSVPVRVDLKEPFSISASGRAYMHRGKDIYISLRLMGFEVAVLYVNQDSIFAADKYNRRYLAERIGDILDNASVTVADIQDLLIGRVFVNGKGTITPASRSNVNLKAGADDWTITPKTRVANAEYSFTINNQTNTLDCLTVTYKDKSVSCNYTGAASTEWGTFMSQARVNVPLKQTSVSAGLRWTWSSAKGAVDSSVKWRTPSGYKRVDGAALLNAYSGAKF